MEITKARHPEYGTFTAKWKKWRLTFRGGDDFIDEYLKRFSDRESGPDFTNRKSYSYCPAFAKAAVVDIKNAIFQRMTEVTRESTSETYTTAVAGKLGGVDLNGTSMNAFIGREILPELLSMAKIGVYVDMPIIESAITKADTIGARPYLYIYKTEDILSWTYAQTENGTEFATLLLKEVVDTIDEETGLIDEQVERYRLLQRTDAGVEVTFYDKDNKQIDVDNQESNAKYTLNIPGIPFVVFELNDSLLSDIANHQIALLNMASSDINYSLRCNFPFYVEQFDPRMTSQFLRQADESADGTEDLAKTAEIEVGAATGRRYPKDMNAPEFINPSPDPLMISMEKENQIKAEIRQLVALALSNIEPKMASAESKREDNTGLEAGLSYIGLELELGERKIASYWLAYEGKPVEDATVTYPEKYSLKTEDERRKEVSDLSKSSDTVPSPVYKKEIAKKIAKITVGHEVANETMSTIIAEIDAAAVINTDPDVIAKDVEAGLVDKETASLARGYPAGSVDKAKKEHAERVAAIEAAQKPAARGVDDADPDTGSGSKEKTASKETTKDGIVTSKQRGPAK